MLKPNPDRFRTGGDILFPVPLVANPDYVEGGSEPEEIPSPSAPWDAYIVGGGKTEGLFANAGAIRLAGFVRQDIEEFEGKGDPRFEVTEDGTYVEWIIDRLALITSRLRFLLVSARRSNQDCDAVIC